MFDIGWTEMLVVACVAIIVVGPKDLPKMLRSVGQTIRKVRGMASDFQRQFNDALKETELDDIQKDISESQTFAPLADAKKAMDDFKSNVDNSVFEAKKDITSDADVKAADAPTKSTAKKPASKTVAKRKPATKKSTPKKPATKKPVAQKASTRKPAAKTAAKKPVVRTAAAKPAAKKPAPRKKAVAAKDTVGQRTKSSSVRKPGAAAAKSRDATA